MKIILSGDPVPAGRPRFRIVRPKSGPQFVSTYSEPETVKYQTALRFQAQAEMNGAKPYDCALEVVLRVYVTIPKSFSGKKHRLALDGVLRPVTRPDLDNYIKQLDALNGVVWLDDSQIVVLRALKLYSDHPGVEIEIAPVTLDTDQLSLAVTEEHPDA